LTKWKMFCKGFFSFSFARRMVFCFARIMRPCVWGDFLFSPWWNKSGKLAPFVRKKR
jgi:hypothetical protein